MLFKLIFVISTRHISVSVKKVDKIKKELEKSLKNTISDL